MKSCVNALKERFTVHDLAGCADPDALLREIGPDIRGIAGGKVSAGLLEKLPKLEIIAVSGVGYDSVDAAAARARNIRLTNTPGVLTDAVAELTIGMMIALSRRIPQGDRFIRDGRWPGGAFGNWSELKNKTLGILGLGRIGREIAEIATALKMHVIYHGRHQQPGAPYPYYDTVLEMARASDWLVVIAPGTAETNKIISREVMQALGPNGMLVNMARGTMVDQDAMIEMLMLKQLGGAALDVFEKEPAVPEALFGLDNVVLSPHQGSRTEETRTAVGDLVVANLTAHFDGKSLISPIF
ncbi:2-hydroxyacid dehydrogenase [Rhizobium sp. P32RR-XVIII]|uniref:2-hydroxyacid dehydrogenase n=1 Tax=Rhizobium sp. P32RR-XVIII TaxID=2726738 RepID=UPI0014574A6F|nr:2-hydroxyacid dehydrogenase [Rhizobium sp. P32RR-XVIII]NLS03482.1 2-hydroxyacid dehydrogenase [Rhizobium sp. P32RR-XVIII]